MPLSALGGWGLARSSTSARLKQTQKDQRQEKGRKRK